MLVRVRDRVRVSVWVRVRFWVRFRVRVRVWVRVRFRVRVSVRVRVWVGSGWVLGSGSGLFL